jgi:UDP-N-acetyl-D-galactosamine dehydrogenase
VTIVGLGYVGLPLAVAFAKHLQVVGFDVDEKRVDGLAKGVDRNREVLPEDIKTRNLTFTADPSCLADASVMIVTVPTPVDENNEPDLRPLVSASKAIGTQLARRRPGLPLPLIVYESTTFPGCTEEVCVPVIESASGQKCGQGFRVGYSPERVNFGDREHNLETVIKVVAGQDQESADLVEALYRLICKAGTHRAPDIRTAEAAKVIENIQRDLNIALVNELAIIFDRLGVSTTDVLAAASTKWNFVRFRPGLVGGHCIPVDPYYLTHRATRAGYHSQVILAGRILNEQMPDFIGDKVVALLERCGKPSRDARALVLGVAFKADITDTRNTKVVRLAGRLEGHGALVVVHDPVVDPADIERLGLRKVGDPFKSGPYDAVIVATPHKELISLGAANLSSLIRKPGVLVDVAGALKGADFKALGVTYWRP